MRLFLDYESPSPKTPMLEDEDDLDFVLDPAYITVEESPVLGVTEPKTCSLYQTSHQFNDAGQHETERLQTFDASQAFTPEPVTPRSECIPAQDNGGEEMDEFAEFEAWLNSGAVEIVR